MGGSNESQCSLEGEAAGAFSVTRPALPGVSLVDKTFAFSGLAFRSSLTFGLTRACVLSSWLYFQVFKALLFE